MAAHLVRTFAAMTFSFLYSCLSRMTCCRATLFFSVFAHSACLITPNLSPEGNADSEVYDRVIQELVLAERAIIVCGFEGISWQHFNVFTKVVTQLYLESLLNRPHVLLDQALNEICWRSSKITTIWSQFRSYGGQGIPLWSLLHHTCVNSLLRSTDPRDRVYGLSALVGEEAKRQLSIDYSESTPSSKVFTITAIIMLGQNFLGMTGLITLNYCYHGQSIDSKLSGLPSWVPDWTCNLAMPIGTPSPRPYSASGSSVFKIAERENTLASGCLVLSGFVIDVIIESRAQDGWFPPVGEEKQFLLDWKDCSEALDTLLAKKGNTAYHSKEEIQEALWRTPIRDRFKSLKAQPDHQYGYQVLVGLKGHPQDFVGDTAEWRLDMSYDYRQNIGSNDRRYLITQQGYLGLGPRCMQSGDVVCLFSGGTTPFIIRRGDEGKYLLVGEAYVHGMMEGEMMENHPEIEEIVLC